MPGVFSSYLLLFFWPIPIWSLHLFSLFFNFWQYMWAGSSLGMVLFSSYRYSVSPLNLLISTVVVVHLLSHVWLFATPWTAASQDSLSFIISWSLLRFMSIESVMPSNHVIPCHCLLLLPSVFPSIVVFSHELAHGIRCQSIGASTSTAVLAVNIQGWFPLGLSTGLIYLQSKRLSRVFSTSTVLNAKLKHFMLLSWPGMWDVLVEKLVLIPGSGTHHAQEDR